MFVNQTTLDVFEDALRAHGTPPDDADFFDVRDMGPKEMKTMCNGSDATARENAKRITLVASMIIRGIREIAKLEVGPGEFPFGWLPASVEQAEFVTPFDLAMVSLQALKSELETTITAKKPEALKIRARDNVTNSWIIMMTVLAPFMVFMWDSNLLAVYRHQEEKEIDDPSVFAEGKIGYELLVNYLRVTKGGPFDIGRKFPSWKPLAVSG